MFNIGPGELMAIAIVALIVLGPQRLPQALRSVGRAVAELRRISGGFQEELRRAIDETEIADSDQDDSPQVAAADSIEVTSANPAASAIDDDEPERMLLPTDIPDDEPVFVNGNDPAGSPEAVGGLEADRPSLDDAPDVEGQPDAEEGVRVDDGVRADAGVRADDVSAGEDAASTEDEESAEGLPDADGGDARAAS